MVLLDFSISTSIIEHIHFTTIVAEMT